MKGWVSNVDTISQGANAATVMPLGSEMGQNELLIRIGQLTRLLRDGLYELGLTQTIEEAAKAIPDARERLRYIAHMTEQAATEVLTTIETAQPKIDAHRSALNELLADMARGAIDAERLERTLTQGVSTQDELSTHLMQIMMAQSFQDLTGQVIIKLMDLVKTIETELVDVLVAASPPGALASEKTSSLLNGPQIDKKKTDVVCGQDQVDDLLSSLGF